MFTSCNNFIKCFDERAAVEQMYLRTIADVGELGRTCEFSVEN